MVITYFGEGCFRIQSGQLSLVTDPPTKQMKPDIILKTALGLGEESPDGSTITGPGEYEIKDTSIRGIQIVKESNDKIIKTVYAVVMEGISLGFMGELFGAPDPDVIQALGDIDILFIPVGGKPYLDAEEAAKVVKQIEPHIVIPSFYKNPKDFLEEMGQKTTPQEKLVIKKKELIEAGDNIKIICLTH